MGTAFSLAAAAALIAVFSPAAAARARRLAPGLLPAWSTGSYAMRADGSGLRRLTRGARDSAPNGSPHGMSIVFTRAGAIYRMRTDGSRVQRLTVPGRDEELYAPDWQPLRSR